MFIQNIAEIRIIGRIGSIDVKDKVAYADIASNYPRKVNGRWEKDTHWNQITIFGDNIKFAEKLEIGDLVHVTGRVRQNRFEKDGKTIYGVDLIADQFSVLAKKGAEADEPLGED
jgi:single-strand DNA-binding protein